LAMQRAREIAERGKVPIICGGAGMYVRALTHGLADTPPSDPALRATFEHEPLETLVSRLRALDPNAAVDEKNARRVIRALEVCLLSGRPFSSFREEWATDPAVRGAILTRPRESLHFRIAQRTAAMFREGVVEEVAAIGELGPTASQMLGLREIRALIAGDLSREECEERVAQATRQYAKRQLTWFRRERGYAWIDLDGGEDAVSAMQRIAQAPHGNGQT
jgi:tRNA dimethylallyltransferase